MGYLNEELFNAIDILMNKKLSKLPYDKTIIGIIIDDSNKDDHWYTIKYENIRFKAYGENQEYKKNDVVRIQVINGDFSKTKFITGFYITE